MIASRMILAMMCMVPLSAAEDTSFETKSIAFQLEGHSETLNPKDHTKFESWILSKNPSRAKKALLTSTLTSTYSRLSAFAPNESPLERFDVITIEPGIYLEGRGGIRIENTIVIEESGARSFFTLPIQPVFL